MSGRMRLFRLRELTEAVEADMIDERARVNAITRREPTRVVTAFNLFQTPEPLAARMAQLASGGASYLEPSAGLGRLLHAIGSAQVTAVEIAPQCCEILYRDFPQVRLLQRDFLALGPSDLGQFDRVVMNPPFKRGLDVKHIIHAYSLLAPGGLLVGLCYNGTTQNAKLRPLVDRWEVLPENTFRESGTGASVVLVEWRKS